MKRDLVSALIRAHYENDERHFKAVALQAAARDKSEDFKKQVQQLTERPRLLHLNERDSQLVEPVAPVSFDDLVLADGVRSSLEEIAEEHGALVQLMARGLDARRRLLFHGPPGNGKTSAAAALASLLGVSCYAASLPRLVASHLGETAANLARLFPALGAGVCLVFDEVDSIGSTRDAGSAAAKESAHTVNALLSLLDRTQGGLLVATTNRRDMLDPALLRRFDLELEFPAPSTEERARLADQLALKHRLVDRSAVYLGESVSFDDVTKAVRLAARREALREAREIGAVA